MKTSPTELFDRLVERKKYRVAGRLADKHLVATWPTVYDADTCTVQIGTIRTKDDNGQPISPPVTALLPATWQPDGTLRTKALVQPRKALVSHGVALETKEVFRRNYDAMALLLEETGVGRRINMDSWRPTEQSSGTLPGVFDNENLTILATDGILAIYRRVDGTAFVGHVQRFTGKVESLGQATKGGYSAPRKAKPKKKSKAERLMEEFENL